MRQGRWEVQVRCSQCGTLIPDGEPTCPTCGTSTADMAAVALATAPVAYEPGPSFVDLASLPLDMSAVPSWLHDFGTSVHDDDGLSPAPMLEPRAAPVQTDPTLPRWLAEPRPGAQGEEVFADLPWDTDETV